jgi:bacteriocin biosynthesis cyclodehydratase domain-containing protein
MSALSRLPKFALPFTVLCSAGTVRLAAGEDCRYTLSAPELETWFPAFLRSLDGRTPVERALHGVPEARRPAALRLVERLYEERVLVDGTASDAHAPQAYRLEVEGSASWSQGRFEAGLVTGDGLPILCQDALDYDAVIRFNRLHLDTARPWLWATTGPMSRAYLSPLFLPHAGPCAACLLSHFRRLSPVSELYEELVAHSRKGNVVAPVPFPAEGEAILRELIRWKVRLATEEQSPGSLYRLHVLEVRTLEVSSHRVPIDPECPECRSTR